MATCLEAGDEEKVDNSSDPTAEKLVKQRGGGSQLLLHCFLQNTVSFVVISKNGKVEDAACPYTDSTLDDAHHTCYVLNRQPKGTYLSRKSVLSHLKT